jgi:fructoselysine-6-P-deglycase FrlB-like protein
MSSLALDASAFGTTLSARFKDGAQLSEVFLVACGGSLVDLYGSRYLLASETRRLRADAYTSNEFVHATPKALGKDSVVIVCTHGGGTRETVEATRIAQSAGALTVALTHNEVARVLDFSDFNIVYDWGDDSRVSDNPMAISLSLCAEILRHVEGYPAYDDFRTAMAQIDGVVDKACEAVRERAAAFANAYGDETLFYILSSGPSFGHARGFAACSLMEMQWLNGCAIHSGEFFHGPFEITDDETNFIVLMNDGRTRPLDERVVSFLDRHAGKYEVVDAGQLGIGTLPESVREYFNPVLFYSVMCVYRAALADVRDHSLDKRRYMGKVDY